MQTNNNSIHLVDPYTKRAMERDEHGNYVLKTDGNEVVYPCYEGCCDFSSTSAHSKGTKAVYDEFYMQGQSQRLSSDAVTITWSDPTVPWRQTLLDSLGTLSGQRILLVGNGKSYREFYFLLQGATVVFTDLSISAVIAMQKVFRNSELWSKYQDHIEFHAVDAVHMPFPDGYFDIVVGSKVVGFIENRKDFFTEVSRCLKPGGKCRFVDDAFSPAWERVRSVWRPVKVHVLWRFMSPLAKVRSGGRPDCEFGFKKESLFPYLEQCGFSRMVYIREYFFLRLAQFAWAKTIGWNARKQRYAKPLFLLARWIDVKLAHTCWMQQNSLPLIFGFDK